MGCLSSGLALPVDFADACGVWLGGCLGASVSVCVCVCVVGWVVCVGIFLSFFCSAVVQFSGFEAGTVLSLIPLWGVGGVAMHCQAG